MSRLTAIGFPYLSAADILARRGGLRSFLHLQTVYGMGYMHPRSVNKMGYMYHFVYIFKGTDQKSNGKSGAGANGCIGSKNLHDLPREPRSGAKSK